MRRHAGPVALIGNLGRRHRALLRLLTRGEAEGLALSDIAIRTDHMIGMVGQRHRTEIGRRLGPQGRSGFRHRGYRPSLGIADGAGCCGTLTS